MMGFFESAWNSGRLSATGVSNLSSLFSKLTTTTVKSGSSIIGGISTGRTIVGAKSGMTTSGITTSIGTSWGEAGIVGRSSILPSGMTGPIVASLPIGITNVTSAPTVTMKLTEKSTIQNLTSTRSAESLSTKNRNDQLASAELMETQENEKSSKGDKTPSEYEI